MPNSLYTSGQWNTNLWRWFKQVDEIVEYHVLKIEHNWHNSVGVVGAVDWQKGTYTCIGKKKIQGSIFHEHSWILYQSLASGIYHQRQVREALDTNLWSKNNFQDLCKWRESPRMRESPNLTFTAGEGFPQEFEPWEAGSSKTST